MDQNILFLRTLEDLSAKSCSNDEYEILRASLLIRSLLIDGSKSLVDHVNRELRLKLRFSFSDTTTGYSAMVLGMNPDTWSIQDGFDPETGISAHEITVGSRDNLLAAIVLVHGGEHYSVKDVVLHVANIMGGVHKGTSKSSKEKALSELNIWFGGIPIAINQLKAICRVIIRGLEPLKRAIDTGNSEQNHVAET